MAGLSNGLMLRQAQKLALAMTPQLQQAIRLLQLSTLELRAEIQQAVEQNPLLELADDKSEGKFESLESLAERELSADHNDDFDPFDNDASVKTADAAMPETEHSMDLEGASPQGVERERYTGDTYSAGLKHGQAIDKDSVYEGETSEDLHDHLMWQLNLSPLRGADRLIAENIIDGIDDSGYLQESLESITATVSADYPEVTQDEVLSILKLIQRYDPLAVGSRSVQECLEIQLMERESTPARDRALIIVRQYLKQLSIRDFRGLCSKLGVKEAELKDAIDLITSLNPRPGHFAIREKSDFVIPDVVVARDENGRYYAMLNSDSIPSVRINEHYRRLSKQATTEQDRNFFKNNLQEANWFLQSIAKRNETLMKVANAIVEHQQEFMDQGESAMHPMILNDIAAEIEMHESTVSRITTEKYILTPKGTFELKYFFSSSVNTDNGGSASSTAIRARIKALVAEENPRKPLSDAKIVELLEKDGFIVARRTVAKYRELQGIAPSSQRKRLE